MDPFTRIDPTDITDNVFKLLDKDWMLVTAGTPDHYNTMTASWGGFGISGIGRELGRWGLAEYLQVKHLIGPEAGRHV